MPGTVDRNPAAFVSYAHADDHEGGVARFVEHLKKEIGAQIGRDFEIFRDREELKWGDRWRERIDESLDAVTFLIVVVSPTFFGRPECVRELERFRAREQELGRADLILPVVWIEPDHVSEERRPLWELLQGRQHTNWERFRFNNPYPVTARRQIEKLAKAVSASLRRLSIRKG